MPRKLVPASTIHPFHITNRSNNRDWFALPIDVVWDIFSEYLYFVNKAYNLKILCFVLMNNHFHLFARTPDGNMGNIMNYFLREVSRTLSRESRRINHNFGGTYHKSLVDSYSYFMCAYKYIYRNPVEAGICDRVESYRYSTLHGLLGMSKMIIPVEEDLLLFDDDLEETLFWLNLNFHPLDLENIKKAIKKPTFAFPKKNKNGGKNRIFEEINLPLKESVYRTFDKPRP